MKSFQTQIDEIYNILANFQIKFIENLKSSAKKFPFNEDELEENKVPDSSEARRMLMIRRKIIFNLYLATLEDQKQLDKLMKVIRN